MSTTPEFARLRITISLLLFSLAPSSRLAIPAGGRCGPHHSPDGCLSSSPPPLSPSPSPTPAGEAITAAASPPPLPPGLHDDHITSSTLYETTSVRLSPHREHALCSPHNPPVRLSESSRATSRISHHPNNHCQHLELFRLLTAKEEVVFDYRVKCTASLIPVRMIVCTGVPAHEALVGLSVVLVSDVRASRNKMGILIPDTPGTRSTPRRARGRPSRSRRRAPSTRR